MELILLPVPKQVIYQEGNYALSEPLKIKIPDQSLFSVAQRLQNIIVEATSIKPYILIGKGGGICFVRNEALDSQGYELTISEEGIIISYSEPSGAYYAVSTLKQILLQTGKKLPYLTIKDEPDFKRRGIMLDISRDKIPTLETLYRIIDFMADIKLNELQLYIEGFSFGYESFPEVWADQTPILPEEMVLIDRYCEERFIDLVPNQNSFGHMAPWLNRLEYAELAVCPEGCMSPWGTFTKNTTLNPQDERSLQLVLKQYDDLLPYFTSDYFNVGMDEPIELGYGKSEEICKEKGLGRVYLDYLLEVYEAVKKRNKRMMFWGDIIIKYPELINELPKDIIALEWGYDWYHPFEEHLKEYHKAGINFYVCPGTSSWNTVLGRTNNMRENIVNAAVHGKTYGAIGLLNTDWGDNGHVQYLPVSYPAFCLGAAVSWSVDENKDIDVTPYLNRFIFKDPTEVFGKLLWDIGNYFEIETVQIHNATKLYYGFYQELKNKEQVKGYIEELSVNDYIKLESFLHDAIKRLEEAELGCEDAQLNKKEIENGLKYVLHGTKRILYMFGHYENDVEILYELKQEISSIMTAHYQLWTARNRCGGLEHSLDLMRRQLKEYNELLEERLEQ